MDTIRDTFNDGRRSMIEAFAELSALARRAGVDEGEITEAHGRFFDGNAKVKSSFRACVLLAEISARRDE